jgi:hypothetical protein
MSSGLERKETTEAPSLEGLDREARIEAMVEWFGDNFEDPAQETPYESAEGGYIYIWGGPYDAREEIGEAFLDADEDEIEEAIDQIQADGTFDWAPNGNRIQPDDYDEPDRPPLVEQLADLAGQLARIEEHVAALRALRWERDPPVGIGHNRAPFEIDEDEPDFDELQESVEDVRAELEKPAPQDNADREKLDRAQSRFSRFRRWVNKQLSDAVAKYLIGAGATALVTYLHANGPFLVETLEKVVGTLIDWAFAVTPTL